MANIIRTDEKKVGVLFGRLSFGLKLFISELIPLKFFIITASIFGIAFLLITPPFQGADEIVHYYRAYQVSEGQMISSNTHQGIGGILPASLGKLVAEIKPSEITFYPQNKYNEHRTKAALSIREDPSNKKFYNFASSATYSPVDYIGASTGIIVARLMHLPTIATLYAGRLGDLVVWIFLVGAAINFMPRRKWALAVVGLLPMALFQASTLNGDAVTIGSIILFLSLILHFREKARAIDNKVLAGLMAVGILMVLSKEVMFIFLPLVFLLKKDNFKLPSIANLTKACLIVIPLLAFLAWMWAIHGVYSSTTYTNHLNPNLQLSLILRSPYSYVNVLWNTYFYTWGDSITRSFIGIFGWSDAPLSELIVTLGYIGLALVLIGNGDQGTKKWLSKNQKLALCLIAILYWAAVSTALYLYYTPVGFKIVYGLQGRYFLPLALFALVLLPSMKIKIDRILYRRMAIYLPIFLLISSVITVYVRYFVNNV